jgi:hypothetical protein
MNGLIIYHVLVSLSWEAGKWRARESRSRSTKKMSPAGIGHAEWDIFLPRRFFA